MIMKFLPISVALICPHLSSENCNCRKPNTGLIRNFRSIFPDNHQKELYIGDQISDQKCSEELGIPPNSFSVFDNLLNTLSGRFIE